jgi:hypothetical protein
VVGARSGLPRKAVPTKARKLSEHSEDRCATENKKGRSDCSGRPFFAIKSSGLGGAHFGVELGDGAGDAKAPGEDGEGFEFVGDDVLVGGVGQGNAGFVHFFGLHCEVVEEVAEGLDTFLAADGAVAGDEESVFVPGGEGLERVAPTGHGALFVEAGGIGVTEYEVAGVDNFLIGDADDEVGAGVAGIVFDDDGEVAEVEVHREFRGIERLVGEGERGFIDQVEYVGDGTEIALCVLAGGIGLGIFDAFFDGS